MKQEVKKDILAVLNEVLSAIDKDNIPLIKELSDHIIHSASIYQENYIVNVAVLIYSLSKMLEREKIMGFKELNNFKLIIKRIFRKMINSLEKENIKQFENLCNVILRTIRKTDIKYTEYVQWVISKAKVKKAVKIYDHGISLSRVGEILEISPWEAMEYLGMTTIHDTVKSGKKTKDRLKKAREVFK